MSEKESTYARFLKRFGMTNEQVKNENSEESRLVKHEFIQNSMILDQFSVRCSEKWRECLCRVYVYRDMVKIKRENLAKSGNVKGLLHDSLDFKDIERISVSEESSTGILRFICREGTQYYEYSTSEAIEHHDIMRSWPNEILFDSEYRDLIEEHFSILEKVFDEYRNSNIEQKKQQNVGNINYYFYGDIVGSLLVSGDHNFNVDNSVNIIRKEIFQKGGNDKEELLAILKEVNSLVETIQQTKSVPKDEGLFRRILSHMNKYDWFYAEIVSFIGAAILQFVGKP